MSTPAGPVEIPRGLYGMARFFASTRRFWIGMGNFESRVLGDDIAGIAIDRPIYVTSLARAGTTIVTELLEKHPEVTSHHYSDFPNIWTPYWRNYLLQRSRRAPPPLAERAHKDRIQVNQDSPEAVEELIWMAFFEHAHDPNADNVLHEDSSNPPFEAFYRDHVRKLLAVRGARRYLAKGNYNISRLAYIQRLFPNARFLIPLRDPAQHIASLVKQHRLFTNAHAQDPRIGNLLAMSGHFEFGPFRNAVNFGDQVAVTAIREAWEEGREVEGWARYWASLYGHLAKQLEESPELQKACLLFSYEGLCTDSGAVIDSILDHCELPASGFEAVRAQYEQILSLPDYYAPGFSSDELGKIERHCRPVRERLDTG